MLSSGDIKTHDIVPPLMFKDEIKHTNRHTVPQRKTETERQTKRDRLRVKQITTTKHGDYSLFLAPAEGSLVI